MSTVKVPAHHGRGIADAQLTGNLVNTCNYIQERNTASGKCA